MLGQLATTAFQSMYNARHHNDHAANAEQKPVILDTCYALASDGPVVARVWPKFYKSSESGLLETSHS